jgi:hypothetical protein
VGEVIGRGRSGGGVAADPASGDVWVAGGGGERAPSGAPWRQWLGIGRGDDGAGNEVKGIDLGRKRSGRCYFVLGHAQPNSRFW